MRATRRAAACMSSAAARRGATSRRAGAKMRRVAAFTCFVRVRHRSHCSRPSFNAWRGSVRTSTSALASSPRSTMSCGVRMACATSCCRARSIPTAMRTFCGRSGRGRRGYRRSCTTTGSPATQKSAFASSATACGSQPIAGRALTRPSARHMKRVRMRYRCEARYTFGFMFSTGRMSLSSIPFMDLNPDRSPPISDIRFCVERFISDRISAAALAQSSSL